MPTKKNIPTPEALYKYFERYKKYTKANPKKENFYNNKEDKQVSVNREVPYTWNGFQIWLRHNLIIAKLEDYKVNTQGRYSEYTEVVELIEHEIYQDKIQGATAGIYNANIVARDLGLRDKTEVTVKSPILPAWMQEEDSPKIGGGNKVIDITPKGPGEEALRREEDREEKREEDQ